MMGVPLLSGVRVPAAVAAAAPSLIILIPQTSLEPEAAVQRMGGGAIIPRLQQ